METRLGLPPRPVRLLLGGIITFAVVLTAVALAGREQPDVTSPAEGVIVAVDASSLSAVRGFTLRTAGGAAFEFQLGVLENPTEFPPGHLAEHQATSAPVLVYFRVEGGRRVVYRLEDALPSPSPAPPAT
jgi:hypothetical protein